MAATLNELLTGREKPVSVEQSVHLKDALKLMLENDYSQLPILDKQGKLLGLITEKSIARAHFDYPLNFSLDLAVSECSIPAERMRQDDDLSVALDRIKSVDAIIIVQDDNKPIGIITDYDMTQYVRELHEIYTLLQDIETSIEQLIERTFPTEAERLRALIDAFGATKSNPSLPNRKFDDLTLYDKSQLIIDQENWPKFEPVLKQRDFFKERTDKVRSIRNPFMHFQRRPTPLEMQTLKASKQWALSLPRPATEVPADKLAIPDTVSVRTSTTGNRNKYSPLKDWLKARPDEETAIRVDFADIEKLLGDELSSSAYEHPSWWANDGVGHAQSKAWLDAGWRVSDVDFAAIEVTFHRRTAH